MHRLLQSLPDIPAGTARRRRREDYLARAGDELAAEERAKIAEQVMLVLEDARFSELFAPGSRAEVPIVGRLILGGETVRVSGQIDRLAVTQGVCPDCRFQDQPARRRAESRTCRRLTCASSRSTAPCSQSCTRTGRVRAALIWTEVPDLMELSGEVLDAALARVTSAR